MDLNINLRSMLLLIAMLQGVVVAGLLLVRGLRRKQTADLLLAALLFQLACSLIEHFIGFMGVYDYAREHGFDLTFFPFDNPFLYGPLILLYVKALTDRDFSWKRWDWAHFALPIIYLVVHFSIWSLPDAVKFQFLDEAFWGRVIQWVQQVGFYLTSIAYLTYAFRRFQSYRNLIEQEYSNTGKITLDWLRLFLVAFSAYLGFDLLFSVAGHAFQFWYTGWYWLNLTRALLLYYISVTGWSFAQKSSVQLAVLEQRSVQAQEPATSNATGKLTMLPEAVEKYHPQLAQFMEMERPWLDPELTLSVLAEKIGLNASQLSFLVNNGFQQNFNDFVNTYRVEEVKRKLNLPEFQHLSLLGVAFESGFNSKATFNRAFKKLTGNAPSQYAGLKS